MANPPSNPVSALLLGCLCIALQSTAFARNPLDPGDPLEGSWTGQDVSMRIEAGAESYTGVITRGQNSFPFTARADGHKLEGTFRAGENAFDFTATLNGERLALTTGARTFELTRAADRDTAPARPANPLEPPPVRPADPATPAIDPQPRQPAPNFLWPPGRYQVRANIVVSDRMDTGMQRLNLRNTAVTDALFTVHPADADRRQKVDVVVQRMVVRMAGMGQEVSYDSAVHQPGSNPIAQTYSPLINAPLGAMLGPKGEFDEMVGFDALVETTARFDRPSALLLGQQKETIRDGLATMFASDLREALNDSPDDAGERWGTRLRVRITGVQQPLAVKVTGETSGSTPAEAVINFVGKEKPSDLPLGAAMEINVEGRAAIDPRSRVLRQWTTTVTSELVGGGNNRLTVTRSVIEVTPR